MIEVSAGGVVIIKNTVLLLKKYSGIFVLPKGRREIGESLMETALREVKEEASVRAKILSYIGTTDYEYNSIYRTDRIEKTVHWYLMSANSTQCQPLKNEGFVESSFMLRSEALSCLEYENEREIVRLALAKYDSLEE